MRLILTILVFIIFIPSIAVGIMKWGRKAIWLFLIAVFLIIAIGYFFPQ